MLKLIKLTLIRGILCVSITAVAMLPVYTFFYVFPLFTGLIIKEAESDAVQVARHSASLLIEEGIIFKKDLLPLNFPRQIEELQKDFDLIKVKAFSPQGEIIYSTDSKDIGGINKEMYFHEVVAKGNTHTKFVKKDTRTLEGQIATVDVVETYVPIISSGRFIGAFEIYLDITKTKEKLHKVLINSYIVLFTVTLVLLSGVIISLLKARRNIEERNLAEQQLVKQSSELEKKNAELALLYEDMKTISLQDPLTGLANRRLMDIMLEKGFARARRYGRPFSVAMLDIDYFKKYNDTYGHLSGDKLLFDMAQIISEEAREADLVVRYGGEEFLMLLPETETSEAYEMAERIRKDVEEKTAVTISIGVSSYRYEMQKKEDLINKADEALYSAKQNGRNRVEIG